MTFAFYTVFINLALSHSVLSDSLWPPWTIADQTSLSMGYFRQEILEWDVIAFSKSSLMTTEPVVL